MCVKHLTFYISGTKVTLRSNHLPLKKFLLKNTLNECVNIWVMENEDYQIDFNYIKGKNNVLADTLSRLITVDPEVQLNPEFSKYEFRQYCFKELLKARTKVDQKLGNMSSEGENIKINEIKVVYDEEIHHKSDKICAYLPLSSEQLISLQEKDAQVSKICKQLISAHKNYPIRKRYFLDKNDILKDNKQTFHQYIVPAKVIYVIMTMAHDNLGHSGIQMHIQCNEETLLLEGNEEKYTKLLQTLCKV